MNNKEIRNLTNEEIVKKIDEMKERYIAELNKEKERLAKQIDKKHPWLGYTCWFSDYEIDVENKNAIIGTLTGFDPQKLIEGKPAFQKDNRFAYTYCLPIKEDDFKIYKE